MAEHQVDTKRNLPLYGAADESTSATDKEDEVENVRQNGSAPPIEEAREANEAPVADEYPHGLSLFFIVLAIMLATFIISLDQVSDSIPFYNLSVLTLTLPDNCRYCHPQNHRSIPRSRQSIMVRLGILHDFRWLPDLDGQSIQVF
jgi:hypothetical protein